MAFSKHTWNDDEVITKELLNRMEDGIAANDTALDTKVNASALTGKAAKGAAIAVANATEASGANPTKEEFKKVVDLVNACKAELNKMNA